MKSVHIRLTLLLTALVVLGVVVRASTEEKNSASPTAEQATSTSTSLTADSTISAMRGMQSCAGSACHGNSNVPSLTAAPGKDCWKSSLTHFLVVDPHQNSFDVLKSELSQRITKYLRKGSSVAIPEATNDARCLACHVNPSLASNSVSNEQKDQRTHGVSCEACHGNAGDWLSNHTTWNPSNRAKEIQSVHFRDLNNLETRAKTCAGCHVGSPANADGPVRDMNHDMIAAGHPALDKSMDGLIARLPKHWQEKDRSVAGTPARSTKGVDKEYEKFKAFTNAMESLKVDRMNRSDKNRTPQPEFSEQTCTDCHRSLIPKDAVANSVRK